MVRASSSADPIAALQTAVPTAFEAAQKSTATHRKGVIGLHARFLACAAVTVGTEGGGVRLTGEKAFQDAIRTAVSRVLAFKRATPAAERIIAFVGAFVKYATEQAKLEAAEDGEDAEDESPADRLALALLKLALKGLGAKDKNARYRCSQLLGVLVVHLGALDEDTLAVLRSSLIERVCDKEAYIRVEAVRAMAWLQSALGDDDAEDEDSPESVLLEVMATDPNACVGTVRELRLTAAGTSAGP